MLHTLDQESQNVLKDILAQTKSVSEGVDALRYRATHEGLIGLLDQLEQYGYLRRENDKYWVSLTALVQLDVEVAKRVMEQAELLFDALKAYYRENQKDHILLSELANRVGLGIGSVKECLSYMVEGSWWGGRSSDFFSTDNPHVKPSESILKYRGFKDVINQVREWQAQRVQDRQYLISRRLPPQTLRPIGSVTDQVSLQREKPLWYDQLPNDLQALLDEVYVALGAEMRALTSMGLRTVIDMVCNDLVGDIGGFAKKLNALEKKGYVNANGRSILEIAIDVGSASAHRGHNPNREDLNTLLDIVEHLLKEIYILRPASERLKETTPQRKRTTRKAHRDESR